MTNSTVQMDALAARFRARSAAQGLTVRYINLDGRENVYHATTVEQRDAFLDKLQRQGRSPLSGEAQ